jgi:hypothetical protein
MEPRQEAFMGPEWKVAPLVEVQTVEGTRLVRVGRAAVACYPQADSGMERITAVNLAEAGLKAGHVAAAFGITPQHLSRLRGRARRQGSTGLATRKRGPRAPPASRPPCAAASRRCGPRPDRDGDRRAGGARWAA